MTNEDKICEAFLQTIKRYENFGFIRNGGDLCISQKIFDILYSLEILINLQAPFARQAQMYDLSYTIRMRRVLKDHELELTNFQIVQMFTDDEYIIKNIIE